MLRTESLNAWLKPGTARLSDRRQKMDRKIPIGIMMRGNSRIDLMTGVPTVSGRCHQLHSSDTKIAERMPCRSPSWCTCESSAPRNQTSSMTNTAVEIGPERHEEVTRGRRVERRPERVSGRGVLVDVDRREDPDEPGSQEHFARSLQVASVNCRAAYP